MVHLRSSPLCRFSLVPGLHPDWMLMLFFAHTHLTVTVTLCLLLVPKVILKNPSYVKTNNSASFTPEFMFVFASLLLCFCCLELPLPHLCLFGSASSLLRFSRVVVGSGLNCRGLYSHWLSFGWSVLISLSTKMVHICINYSHLTSAV